MHLSHEINMLPRNTARLRKKEPHFSGRLVLLGEKILQDKTDERGGDIREAIILSFRKKRAGPSGAGGHSVFVLQNKTDFS
jgi:hypothetical protein